ncbi:MAG: metalloregulator ArsR/SmtB family transcription factor [Fimbriimonas sp.]|nr:metalloregulator ArsR/SmtB family transcription factor [Fimbriimonas sp.]
MVQPGARNDVFDAIAAPARRQILRMLATKDTPVTEIADSFDMTISAVSQHLAVLRSAGLVIQSKNGRQRIYRLNAEPLRAVSEWLDFYQPYWNDRLLELGRYLDENPADLDSQGEK